MDAQHAQAAPALDDTPFLVTAQPGSPLAGLLDRRERAKAEAEEIEGLVKALDAQIKNELTLACQGRTRIDIDSPGRARMRLAWRTPRRFNRKRFAGDHPDLDAQYTEWGTPYWELGPLKRGGRG